MSEQTDKSSAINTAENPINGSRAEIGYISVNHLCLCSDHTRTTTTY
jgi:hypothetical protein